MTIQLSFSAIGQADMAAAQAWELLLPVIETDDRVLAARVCEALRAWTWKTLDRRRRDDGLREWADLLNRVEAFFADRFSTLAAKIELLAELIHDSLAVADIASLEDLLHRKHVAPVLAALAEREGGWVSRSDLMQELGLKPANMTRLMALLLDVGWIEQALHGREAAYRASVEGLERAQQIVPTLAPLAAASLLSPVWDGEIERMTGFPDSLLRIERSSFPRFEDLKAPRPQSFLREQIEWAGVAKNSMSKIAVQDNGKPEPSAPSNGQALAKVSA